MGCDSGCLRVAAVEAGERWERSMGGRDILAQNLGSTRRYFCQNPFTARLSVDNTGRAGPNAPHVHCKPRCIHFGLS
jgi:hypothetical protein